MLPLLLLLAPAADAPAAVTLEATPTWRAVGIEATYAGDDNANLTAEFEWRTGGAAWRPGVVPVIDSKLRRVWASVGPLSPGTVIEVRLTLRDPDLAQPLVATTTTTTRTYPSAGQGNVYHVAPTGKATNPGTRDQPFDLTRASTAVRAGDTVRIAAGVYKVGDLFAGLRGEAGKPITFVADGEVIFDGGVDLPKGHAWKHHGGDHYSTAAPKELTTAPYAVQESQRLLRQANVAALTGEKRVVPRAWTLEGGTVHVRTGGKPASECAYSFGVLEQAFRLVDAKHVILRGFTVRHYASVGVRLSGATEGCVVEDCTFRELPGAIFLKNEATRFNLVRRCTLTEPGLGDFPWEVIKNSDQARQGVYCVAGRGNCFYDNTVSGWFDGFAIESWKNPTKLELNRDVDVMNNTITDIGDDAIEADGGGVNMRLWHNTMRNVHTALSLAPIERGPVWVARNHATFRDLFFKLNVGGAPAPAWCFCDHNTGVCTTSGPDGGTGISLPLPKEECRNKVFRNNVLVVNEWCVRNGRPNLTLDGNLYFHVPTKPVRRFQWEGKTFPTLDAFRKATGQEAGGQYADPKLLADLRLGPGSPCKDRGVRIRGINDTFNGTAPDVGAFESD